MNKKITQRIIPEEVSLPEKLHPVLQRVYAARNVTTADELDYSLASLLPFNTLTNIDKAVDLLQAVL